MTAKWVTIRVLVPLTILTVILLTVLYFHTASQPAKNSAWDPVVNEEMNQAKTLQKLGKLKEALAIYERHAAEDHPVAMFYAAKFHSRGWGTVPNLTLARGYYLKAVEYSFPYRGETAYELGRLFQRSKGEDCNIVAMEWFRNALKWNYVKAALQLAIHYEKGLGVEPDPGKASEFYEIAVAADNAQAMIKYARLLTNQELIGIYNPDKATMLTLRALRHLERKANAGSASAAKLIGRLYRDGDQIPQAPDKARKWLRQAAHLGSTGGMHDYAHMLLADEKKAAPDEAIEWLKRAAEMGHGGSMTALGRFHLKEQYGLKKEGAIRWFEQGSEVPHGGSLEELARLHHQGILIKKDKEKAIKLAQRGQRLGHSGSIKLLAEMMLESSTSELDKTTHNVIRR